MSAGVVIAGGGLAGQRCAETLRRSGFDGSIVMVCAESHRPYDRPPLSKAVLAGADAEASLSFRPEAWYRDREIELRLGVAATGLEPGARRLRLAGGGALDYEHLLIATGSRARRLELLDRFPNVTTLRTLEDARVLRAALGTAGRLAIVGAGFIGQEVASAARRAGVAATMIEADAFPLQRVLGPALGPWFRDLHLDHGVEMLLGARLAGVRGSARVEALLLADGRAVECDHVVVGVGVSPELGWVEGSGLPTTGVPVDVDGRAELPGVYAAGDAAATFEPALGRRVTGAHWESAGRQGARAAKAMLGLEAGPVAASSFWSDLYGTRIQYLGHASLADAMTIDGDPDDLDFTATFTHAGRPVAALLVGRPRRLPEVRALLTF
ncbi:MAG TPA: FAD-dependent oxidoreductase [Solirubrobacteraceae bacterium]|nr:FAD-dependent oxidoreductase [Solirubrobacteraceae bacterium]